MTSCSFKRYSPVGERAVQAIRTARLVIVLCRYARDVAVEGELLGTGGLAFLPGHGLPV